MSSTDRAIASRSTALAAAAALGLSTIATGTAGSVDELIELNMRAWAGETELLSDEVLGRLRGSWGGSTSVDRLAEVYAPDAVHTARYLDRTKRYTGLEEILGVARDGSQPNVLGRVDFEAPEGELAWAEVIDAVGGIACLFRAVDGMITRHDCVVPISG